MRSCSVRCSPSSPITSTAAIARASASGTRLRTTGSATINRLKDLANVASEKAGTGDIETVVTKHYHDTTHAKTSEYRVKNKDTIGQIYAHARRVWAEEKGRGQENRLIIRNG